MYKQAASTAHILVGKPRIVGGCQSTIYQPVILCKCEAAQQADSYLKAHTPCAAPTLPSRWDAYTQQCLFQLAAVDRHLDDRLQATQLSHCLVS